MKMLSLNTLPPYRSLKANVNQTSLRMGTPSDKPTEEPASRSSQQAPLTKFKKTMEQRLLESQPKSHQITSDEKKPNWREFILKTLLGGSEDFKSKFLDDYSGSLDPAGFPPSIVNPPSLNKGISTQDLLRGYMKLYEKNPETYYPLLVRGLMPEQKDMWMKGEILEKRTFGARFWNLTPDGKQKALEALRKEQFKE